jgi:hypothetical protein
VTTTPPAPEPTSGALLPDTGAGAGHMLPPERPDEGAEVTPRLAS